MPGGNAGVSTSRVAHLRRAAWHLRAGGLAQLRSFTMRTHEGGTEDLSALRGAEGSWRGIGRRRRLRFAPADLSYPIPARTDIRVGVILDDFSLAGFAWEFDCIPLMPGMDIGELAGLNMILIESAWAGNNGVWQHQLMGTKGPSSEVRRIILAAQERKIPVILWNKEDPPHYSDFLSLARLCNFVFTTDENMLPRYRADLGHDRVAALPFAAQPRIHNPVRPRHGWHARDIAFAGMYFRHKYPERRQQMDFLLGGALLAGQSRGHGLEIFSRYLKANPDYQFPGGFGKKVVGSLSYMQMLTAYKAYKIFLNVNSVVDSPTMCSRRVFEMTAAGATVVSTASPALERLFPGGEIPVVRSALEAENTISVLLDNPDYADRLLHLAQRRIWREHTYSHRAAAVLKAVRPDLVERVPRQKISLLVCSIRPDQLDHVIEGVSRQRDVDVELLYGTHGFAVNAAEFADKCAAAGIVDRKTFSLPDIWSLGECLNFLVRQANGEFAAKWDDDDLYGPWYLFDQLQALQYSGATVVGKRAHYMEIQGPNTVILRNGRFEHRFSHFVAGPTLMAELETFRSFPFPAVSQGEDTGFLKDVLESGGRIYAADRFNYCQVRAADVNRHTWQISADELMKSSVIKFFGKPDEQVFL